MLVLLAAVALGRAGRAFHRAGYDLRPDRTGLPAAALPSHALGADESDPHGTLGGS